MRVNTSDIISDCILMSNRKEDEIIFTLVTSIRIRFPVAFSADSSTHFPHSHDLFFFLSSILPGAKKKLQQQQQQSSPSSQSINPVTNGNSGSGGNMINGSIQQQPSTGLSNGTAGNTSHNNNHLLINNNATTTATTAEESTTYSNSIDGNSQHGLPLISTSLENRGPGFLGDELVMLYDYKAQAPDDLSVRRGDWVYADLKEQKIDGWIWAFAPKLKKYGFIPKAYARPPAMTSI